LGPPYHTDAHPRTPEHTIRPRIEYFERLHNGVMAKNDHVSKSLRHLCVPIADLHEDPSNVRRHTQENVAAIAQSLERFGQQTPIVVNRENGNIVEAGNGTLRAAQSLGWEQIAAVFVADDPVTACGYAIADNRIADLAAYDLRMLLDDLQQLETTPPGFSDGFVSDLAADLDGGPPPPDDWAFTVTVGCWEADQLDSLEGRLQEIADLAAGVTLKVKRT